MLIFPIGDTLGELTTFIMGLLNYNFCILLMYHLVLLASYQFGVSSTPEFVSL